jgi:hypothetical protein
VWFGASSAPSQIIVRALAVLAPLRRIIVGALAVRAPLRRIIVRMLVVPAPLRRISVDHLFLLCHIASQHGSVSFLLLAALRDSFGGSSVARDSTNAATSLLASSPAPILTCAIVVLLCSRGLGDC